jgi:ABC-type nitrate/sulfonate/bicarbonate transport system permease component
VKRPSAIGRAAALVMPAAPILALCAAWEVFARSGAVTPFMLPPFSEVLARIYVDAAAWCGPTTSAPGRRRARRYRRRL